MKFFEKIRRMIKIYRGIHNTEYMTNDQMERLFSKHKDKICSACSSGHLFLSTEVHYLRTYDVTQGKPLYCITCQQCGLVSTYRYHFPHEVSLEEIHGEIRHKKSHLELVK